MGAYCIDFDTLVITTIWNRILTAENSNLGVPLAADPSLPVNPVKLGTVPTLLVETVGGFGPLADQERGGGVFPGRRPVKYSFASAA